MPRMDMPSNRRGLYPEIQPFDSGMLRVSDLHTLYYEQCGNPHGKPAVFLHGGPGAGCNAKCRRFFIRMQKLLNSSSYSLD